MGTIFHTAPTRFGQLSHQIQGADIQISVKHATAKEVKKDIHILWCQ